MFEDYFFDTTKIDKKNPVPIIVYWMMQFIDFSFHESKREYYPYNNERSIDETVQTDIYKPALDSDITNFYDMIKSFKVLFNV